jgi:hypothetical protein
MARGRRDVTKSPATTDRLVDLDGEVRRRRGRRLWIGLWVAVLLALAGQSAVAYYLYRQKLEAREASAGRVTEQQVAQQLEVVRGLLRQGKVEAAEVHLEGLLARKPGHGETRSLLAQVRELKAMPASPPDAALLPPASAPAAPRAGDGGAARPDAAVVARVEETREQREARWKRIWLERYARRKRRKQRQQKQEQKKAPPAEQPPEVEKSAVVRDLTLPRKVLGSAGRGERIFRMGCGLCHGRTARRIGPAKYSKKGWARYFASGAHGRHDLLRSNFTRSELADVKAYLVEGAGR